MLQLITQANDRFPYNNNAYNFEIYGSKDTEPFGFIQIEVSGIQAMLMDNFYKEINKDRIEAIKIDWKEIEQFLLTLGVKQIIATMSTEHLQHGKKMARMMGFSKPVAMYVCAKEIK